MGAARELVARAGRFDEANVKFEDVKKALLSDDLLHASHGELERFIGGEGRELLRLLFQGHLDARGEARAVGPVVGADFVDSLGWSDGSSGVCDHLPLLAIVGIFTDDCGMRVLRTWLGVEVPSKGPPAGRGIAVPPIAHWQQRLAERARC